MWLFEKRGFVSVVAYDPKYDRNSKSVFRTIAKQGGTHLLVRARIKEDIDWLKETVPSLVVETDKGADYAFRAVITRKQFKQALAKAVDGIDYDSHFKEVARDNSPKSNGRYAAMMNVWTAMSKLQPFSPWGAGGFGSYGGTGYFSGSSGSSKSTSVATSSSRLPDGAKDVEEFLEEYVASGGNQSYRNGGGPRTGFKPKDRVIGYSGAGEVVEVKPSKNTGSPDSVRVRIDGSKDRVTTFISNYLMPEDLPVIAEPDLDEENEKYELGGMYEFLKKFTDGDSAKVLDYPYDDIKFLSDDAFELLTRVQEWVEASGDLTKEILDETHDEILWEASSDEQRIKIWSGMEESIPVKYRDDAVKLFSSLEISSKQ